ncbi:MAG: serine protease, partial [Armatimonadetes bacterium]|nr:serine protease [Armatimonadota bacterium]
MISDVWSRPKARFGMMVAAFLVGSALTGSLLTRPSLAIEQARTQTAAISDAALAQRTSGLAAMEDGFVAIAQRVSPAVVSIRARRTVQTGRRGPDINDLFRDFGFRGPGGDSPLEFRQFPREFRAEGGGSGVIVKSDGWILTNDHVVGGADKVTVKLEDGREFDGTVRRDYRSDLAVIKITASGLQVA